MRTKRERVVREDGVFAAGVLRTDTRVSVREGRNRWTARARRRRPSRSRVAKELEKEKEKGDWRFRRHAWEHAGVVDAFAVPNAGKREGDLVRVDRRRAFVSLETRPDGVGRRDASRRNRARRVRVSRRRRRRGVQSESARRRARRRDFDRKRRLDDVLAPDPPRRLGGARRRRRALGVADARAKHGRDAGNLGVPGRSAPRARATTDQTGVASRESYARVARRTFPRRGAPHQTIPTAANTILTKTALAAYFEKGRAPAARAFVRLCETARRSGGVGFKRRFARCFLPLSSARSALLHARSRRFFSTRAALTKMDDPSWGTTTSRTRRGGRGRCRRSSRASPRSSARRGGSARKRRRVPRNRRARRLSRRRRRRRGPRGFGAGICRGAHRGVQARGEEARGEEARAQRKRDEKRREERVATSRTRTRLLC